MSERESICLRCFHSYVCEQFNEHRDVKNDKCHFYNDHFVPYADVAPVQEWIPVTERLPEPKENAICLNRHGDMMIGTYTEWGWMFPCYFEGTTHWMPLPEPPKEE